MPKNATTMHRKSTQSKGREETTGNAVKGVYDEFEALRDRLEKIGFDFVRIKSPFFLVWNVTNACNSRCLHCYNNSGRRLRDELNHEEGLGVCQQIIENKILNVDIVGGEPLLRKDLFEIVKILVDNHVMVNTISNGYFFDEKNAKLLTSLDVSSVQISIDGACSEIHDELRGLAGSFHCAVRAVKNLVKYGKGKVKIIVSCVLTKRNLEEIQNLVRLCDKWSVDAFRLMAYVPLGRGAENREELEPTKSDYEKVERIICDNYDKHKLTIEWEEPLKYLYEQPLMPSNSGVLTLLANGYLLPNPYFPLSIGNVRKHTIGEYWDKMQNISEYFQTITGDKRAIYVSDILKIVQVPLGELWKYYSLMYMDLIDHPGKIQKIAL